jgi:hypothetical protein
MPKGVICGGAVEGSNQAGAIVTCQAITALPFGSGPEAAETVPGRSKAAISSAAAVAVNR